MSEHSDTPLRVNHGAEMANGNGAISEAQKARDTEPAEKAAAGAAAAGGPPAGGPPKLEKYAYGCESSPHPVYPPTRADSQSLIPKWPCSERSLSRSSARRLFSPSVLCGLVSLFTGVLVCPLLCPTDSDRLTDSVEIEQIHEPLDCARHRPRWW